jgi:hypothetical protein
MALQIRRGTTAERTARRFLVGELIYDTTLQQVYVGDSTDGITGTLGGRAVTAFTPEDARDATAAVFAGGTHTNINFSYNDDGNNVGGLSAAVNLTSTPYVGNVNVTGVVNANGFNGWLEGNVFANDSTLLVDAGNGRIPASVVQGTFTGNVTGNLTGNVTGNVSGNLTGSVLTAAQSNITSVGILTSLAVSGGITGTSFTGNVVTGSITTTSGDLTITPNTNFSNGLDVTSGTTTLKATTVTGQATISSLAASPSTVNVDDGLTSGARPLALVLNGKAADFAFSGVGVEFKVNNGTLTEQLVKLEAFSQSTLSDKPGFNVKVYNSGTSSYDTTPFVADGGGITVNGAINVNNALFVSTATAPTTSTGADGDAAGTVIITNGYIYRCVADWASPGTANIWVRVAFNATPW